MKEKYFELERVADYDIAELQRLESMSINSYFKHILALKRRSDRIESESPQDTWP